MKSLPFLVASGASAISLLLGIWLAFKGASNQSLSNTLQQRQQEVQNYQQSLGVKQQTLQAQQEQINAGNTISQQVGPALLRDMAVASIKNDKIKKVLTNHGFNVELKDEPKASAGAAAPAPSVPAVPAAPKPATPLPQTNMSNDSTPSSPNLPLALLAVTIAILLGSQIGSANQSSRFMQWQAETLEKQIANMQSLEKQADQAIETRKDLVKQSAQLQTQLQSLLNDLLEVSKDDKDAQEIIKKWNIQRTAPAGDAAAAPAAGGAAAPAPAAPAAEAKKP